MKPKPIQIKQFCNNCKNQSRFKIKKRLFLNLYCLKCMACGGVIKYPHRFGKIQGFIQNTNASAVPIMIYIATIFVCGALYTLFFTEIAIPNFEGYLPTNDPGTTFVLMCIYAIPLFVIVVATIAFIKAGLKRTVGF